MAEPERLPSVIGIGFPKAATTALAAALAAHPDVAFSPKKETRFFEQAARDAETVEETARAYRALWPNYDPARHRLAMEWTVSYIADPAALDRIGRLYGDAPPTFLIATRDPVRSVLSSYYYFRTISNDSPAARLSQRACLAERPDVFLDPYRYGRHFAAFRARFPDARLLIVPQAALRRDAGALYRDLFRALGLSETGGEAEPPAANLPYPYRSWRADKVIRFALVKLYGNRRVKQLYSRPDAEKPTVMRLLQGLNRGDYAWEPGVESLVQEALSPDYEAFVEAVLADPNCRLLGLEADLRNGAS